MSDIESLKGGVAVITGAGSGIGEGLARAAAKVGMTVVVADIDASRAEAVAADIRAQGGQAASETIDVRDARALEALAAKVKADHGDVRLLINNAGIEMMGLSWEFTPEQWDRSRAINIDGVFYGVRAFMPGMIDAAKRGKRATIANTASVGGLGMAPLMAPYIVSKHAVISLSECLYLEMEAEKLDIGISVILPGPVATRIFEDAPVTQSNAAEAGRKRMEDHLSAEGMTGEEAGRIIFQGIARGDFFIGTHPEMMQASADRRAAHLSALGKPSLSPMNKDVMKG